MKRKGKNRKAIVTMDFGLKEMKMASVKYKISDLVFSISRKTKKVKIVAEQRPSSAIF